MTPTMTPAEARARFGELLGGTGAKTHQHFETEEGVWRPQFDAAMRLTG